MTENTSWKEATEIDAKILSDSNERDVFNFLLKYVDDKIVESNKHVFSKQEEGEEPLSPRSALALKLYKQEREILADLSKYLKEHLELYYD